MTDRCPPIPIAVGPAARFRGLLALVLLAGCGPPAAMDAPATDVEGPFPRPEGAYEVRLDPTHMVPMRDGVRLATDLYFPVGTDTPLPVVQIRTPYGKLPHRRDASAARYFASHGFAVAVQDMRGRYQSEGEYFVSRADREDGYDMVSWLAEQPWSNGRIGTYGCSYLGENQMQLAATRNPHHAAALPQAAGGSYRYFGVIFGGVTELAASLGWFRGAGSKVFYRIPPGTPREEMLQVEEMINPAPNPGELDFQAAWRTLPYIDMLKASGAPPTDFEAFVSHEPGDPWWDRIGYVQPDDRFDVPALHVNSWYDLGVGETLKLFNLLSDNAESDRARDNQFAIISPTDHCTSEIATSRTVVGERDLGDARLDYWTIYLDWFDHWLRDDADADFDMPRLQYYLMGANEWRTAGSWPVEGTEFRPMYLHSGGSANTRAGDGRLSWEAPDEEQPADTFTYDPDDPVPTIGGPVCCTGTADAPAGGFDQSAVEDRDDVLVYTSEPLDEAWRLRDPSNWCCTCRPTRATRMSSASLWTSTRRAGDQRPGRDSARALPRGIRSQGVDGAGAKCTNSVSTSRPRRTISEWAIGSASKSRPRVSRDGNGISIPAVGTMTRPSGNSPAIRSTTPQ